MGKKKQTQITEAEWLARPNPTVMLLDLGKLGKLAPEGDSMRRLRLFGSACCRRIWNLIPDERARKAVEVAEQFADGLVSEREREQAQADVEELIHTESRKPNAVVRGGGGVRHSAALVALEAVHRAITPISLVVKKGWVTPGIEYPCTTADYVALSATTLGAAEAARPDLAGSFNVSADPIFMEAFKRAAPPEIQAQVAILHDVFGNPFRPAVIDPSWLAWNDRAVQRLAQTLYEERAFDGLPILAEALEEADCANADLLDHCRAAAPHVRGCWVLDLLRGET